MTDPDPREDGMILAVDLGATKLRCALVDAQGTIHAREAIRTPFDASLASSLDAIARRVLGASSVSSAVVGVPGRVDYTAGRLAFGRGQPPSWRATLQEEALARQLGVPVALANDADLATVGEATFGAGAGRDDIVYLTISTGVGAGAVIGRRLLHGRSKLVEIALTLLSVPSGSHEEPTVLEDLASGRGLEAMAREVGIDRGAPEIVEMVRAGDGTAMRVWQGYARAVGTAVVNLAHLFLPEVVVIGGGVSQAGDLVLRPVRDWLVRYGPQDLPVPIDVTVARLGDDAGLVGAAAWWRAGAPVRRVQASPT